MLMNFLGSVILPKQNIHFLFLFFIFILTPKENLLQDGNSELKPASCADPAPRSASPLLPWKHPSTTNLPVSLESDFTGSTWIPPRPWPDATMGPLSPHSYSTPSFLIQKIPLLQIASCHLAYASTTKSPLVSFKHVGHLLPQCSEHLWNKMSLLLDFISLSEIDPLFPFPHCS